MIIPIIHIMTVNSVKIIHIIQPQITFIKPKWKVQTESRDRLKVQINKKCNA